MRKQSNHHKGHISSTERFRRKRNKLFKNDPNCYWCGKLTVNRDRKLEESSSTKDNDATVDHLYSKFQPERYRDGYKGIVVLACGKCNHERGIEEEKLFFLKESYMLQLITEV